MNLVDATADASCVPDADQDAVYSAEDAVQVPAQLRFSNFADVEAFVRDTVDRRFWHDRYGPMADLHSVVVRPSRSESRSSAGREDGTWSIRMARPHWNPLIVAHELAHVAACWRHGVPKGHAEEFRAEYLSIVRHVVPELAGALFRAFADRYLTQRVDLTGWDAPILHVPSCHRVRGAIPLGAATT